MSERGSKSKTKYIVICFILALALPFSSFAVESLSLNESQFSLIWNAQNWNYFRQVYSGNSLSFPGVFEKYFMYDSTSDTSFNGLIAYGRQFNFAYLNTERLLLVVPFSLQNIDTFTTDFFIGLWDSNYNDLRDYISSVEFEYTSTSDYNMTPNVISFNNNYLFSPVENEGLHSTPFRMLRRYNLSFDTKSIRYLTIRINFNSPLPINSSSISFFCGMASDTEIGAQDGQQQAVISGLSGIQGTIDGLFSDLQENDGKILDSLGNLEYILEGDAVTAVEAEQLVEDSLSKGEELGQLGDALASVPKPDINSVTSVIKPNTVLQNNDSASVQLAMSPLYSWDKLLAILGVLVAVFSISYIIFGKKE